MIEIIKGYTYEFEEVERLANEYIAQYNGKLVSTKFADERIWSMEHNRYLDVTSMYLFIEYDAPLDDWQQLFNKISFAGMDRDEVLKAFFKLDQIHASDKTINELLEIYKDESIVSDLCRLNNLEYKED